MAPTTLLLLANIYLNERIDEAVLWCFGHVERMERDRIAKRVYVGECAGSHSVSRHGRDGLIPWKSA